MFDIGWSEFLVIGVVALIAIGPKELPAVLRTAGQWIGKIRRMAAEFQGQFQEALREVEMADLKQQVDEATSGLNAKFDPLDFSDSTPKPNADTSTATSTPATPEPSAAGTPPPATPEPSAAGTPPPATPEPSAAGTPPPATPESSAASTPPSAKPKSSAEPSLPLPEPALTEADTAPPPTGEGGRPA